MDFLFLFLMCVCRQLHVSFPCPLPNSTNAIQMFQWTVAELLQTKAEANGFVGRFVTWGSENYSQVTTDTSAIEVHSKLNKQEPALCSRRLMPHLFSLVILLNLILLFSLKTCKLVSGNTSFKFLAFFNGS